MQFHGIALEYFTIMNLRGSQIVQSETQTHLYTICLGSAQIHWRIKCLQVEKKLLEPPKPTKHEKSPPPKKLSSAKTNAGVAVLKPKKTRTTSTNQSLIAKSKSTNDVKKDDEIKVIASVANKQPQQLPPPVNLLKSQRPPLEIHKIEGDKIIIIRRVPRAHRNANHDLKHKSLPSLSEATVNQVTMFMGVIMYQ